MRRHHHVVRVRQGGDAAALAEAAGPHQVRLRDVDRAAGDQLAVAIQAVLGLVAGDAPSATWDLDCKAVPGQDGADLSGPYIQGPPGGRFIYLSWVTVDEAGSSTLFRRAKLWLDAVPPAVIDMAQRSGLIVGRLGLTDAKGNPRCASVRPPVVQWSAE